MAGIAPATEYNNSDFTCNDACEAKKAKEAQDLWNAEHPIPATDINSQRSDSIFDTNLNARSFSNLHY